MATQVQETTKATTKATTGEAQPKAPRSFSTALHGPEGEVLRVVAVFRKDGGARTFVVHSTTKDAKGKRVNTRGATQTWPSGDAAVKAVERVAQEAIKKGWARSQRVAGFAARPDAFSLDTLPVPKPTKPTSKKGAAR